MSRLLSKHRVVLLATVAGLGAGLIFGNFGLGSKSTGSAFFTPVYAQSVQRPVGFADIVEKVKPAVLSVKVRINAGGNNLSLNEDNPLRGSPFEDFFRRFGSPDGGQGFGLPIVTAVSAGLMTVSASAVATASKAPDVLHSAGNTPWARARASSSRLTAMR